MCNKVTSCSKWQPSLQSEVQLNPQEQQQAVYLMESPTTFSTPISNPSSNDENPRVKFLCSFSGNILPRPQDGKLRYVGGETRIVSVPRDINYEELMRKMRELYDGVTVLKYQQPDEDLDALVSVVNDDDVTNMMEEYDKLGSGDGFTRLRIFLFSHSDQDGSIHFIDGDERDNEKRYVDALNSLNESPDFRKHHPGEFQADETRAAEQYFNLMSLDSNQRSSEMHLPPINLHQLRIPHMGSGQHQQSATAVKSSWSPVYFSPRHSGQLDPRPVAEFPTSPSSARYHIPFAEFSDKNFDRIPDEYIRSQVNHRSLYDHQSHFTENVVLVPAGTVSNDKAGFTSNIPHGPSGFDANSICEPFRTNFQRNSPWKHGEQPLMENGFHQIVNSCTECQPNREFLAVNSEANLHHQFYSREHSDPRSMCNDTPNHERGWVLQQQPSSRADEPRSHISGAGRLNEHYIVDGNSMSIPHGNLADGHHVPLHYVHHEDQRYIRAGSDLGSQVYHDQVVSTGSHSQTPALEECGGRYGNFPYAYGADNICQGTHGSVATHGSWRNVQNPVHGVPSYEVSSLHQLPNGVRPGYVIGALDGSHHVQHGVENLNPWVEPSRKMVGIDCPAVPEHSECHGLKLMQNAFSQENLQLLSADPSQSSPEMQNFATATDLVPLSNMAQVLMDGKLVSMITTLPESRNGSNFTELIRTNVTSINGGQETINEGKVGEASLQSISGPALDRNPDDKVTQRVDTKYSEESRCGMKLDENDAHVSLEDEGLSIDRLSFLPELIASVKKAALESVGEVKTNTQENANPIIQKDINAEEENKNESDTHGDLELDLNNDCLDNAKIEPTNAEREAMDRGLQTIKNDDLEEVRELGSGTYGAVYHGKWKGSDVAIKRIKASCFAGRPSERERLIADFWKEALILSSLHHPNVVSFYGVVRDGPDGSLATVTEFMVNGSLKQFLQKKDRTIDRRKRLIIAMDVAFGMEYLHGKNIVHFDLKCENLLVNMRDPHRPVCKNIVHFDLKCENLLANMRDPHRPVCMIGDLGLSKVKQHTLVSGGVRGTLPWMAPELLSGKSNMVTEKIDVYSFGIVMWEVLTGDEPYADMHCASIIGGIVNNTLRPQIPTWCDPEWKSLMESCWTSDPAGRPSFSEISQRLRTMAAAMNVK